MGLRDIGEILEQASQTGTIEWIYFEGGEPFLFYAVMVEGIRQAAELGFKVGVVTNGYFANDLVDALENLRPLAGLVQDLSVSSDLFHYDQKISRQSKWTIAAADQLGIPIGVISIAQSDQVEDDQASSELPVGEAEVMYRGRAAEKLATRKALHHWEKFTECPYEDLREPSRVHLDPLGHVHICQGISLGNIYKTCLMDICNQYDPEMHPITSALIEGGPAELTRRYGVMPQRTYADACHLCYETRLKLRDRFASILAPDQVYGVY